VKSLLSVKGLRVQLPTASGLVTVLDGVDYEVEPGHTLVYTPGIRSIEFTGRGPWNARDSKSTSTSSSTTRC